MPGPYVRGGIFVQNPHSKEPTLALLKLDKERRPRVLLVPPPDLPVPAVQGGAIFGYSDHHVSAPIRGAAAT